MVDSKTKKNIIIIGNANSIFLFDYCREVLIGRHNVYIISTGDGGIYKSRYSELGVDIFVRPMKKDILRCDKESIIRLIDILKELKNIKIDCIHIHLVNITGILLFFNVWKRAPKRILTFWGGDLFGGVKKGLFSKLVVSMADSITLMIEQNKPRLVDLFGENIISKVRVIDFGNHNLPYLDEVITNNTKNECKRLMNVPDDKLVVHIGYNGGKGHNHNDIIDALAKLDNEIKQRMFCVIPMAYARPDDYQEYKASIEQRMKQGGIDGHIEERFLQDDDLAMFRYSADLFILGHTHDGRSESPIEYIYSGVSFLCKKEVWDNYSEIFDSNDARYYMFDEFDEIVQHIENWAQLGPYVDVKGVDKRKTKIKRVCAWETYREEWRELYD